MRTIVLVVFFSINSSAIHYSSCLISPLQLGVTISSLHPTPATRLLEEGMRVLIPHRATPQALNTLSLYELCHAFNLFIADLTEVQRDELLRYWILIKRILG